MKQESRLHAIIETSVEGIISINESGIVLSFNPAAEKIFKYTVEEVVGKNVRMLMPSEYEKQHDRYIQNYLQGGEPKIIGIGREVSGQRKCGEIFPMWLAVAEFYEQGVRYFAGFIRDLSEEKTYIAKASRYETILEHSVNEIYIFDAESLLFVRANQGALANLKYTNEELLTLTPLDLKPEFDRESFERLILPLRQGEVDKLHFSTVHRRKDGSQYPVDVHLELSEYESRPAFVAIILDISERVNAQEKAKINEEKLAHMDRVRMFGEMAGGIAHEINQPLTAITSYAKAGQSRLQADTLDIEKIGELLQKISSAAIRASDVISRLRKMLKPHTKQTEHVNINTLIEESVAMAKSDSQALDFTIDLRLGEKLPKVVGDAIQIQQVILNLIRNAMESAFLEDKDNKRIILCTSELDQENRVKVSVEDLGCGISHQDEDQVFSPFYTTKPTGMGIGLAICQSIIQEHGGKLWFTRNEHKGTTFHFTLTTAVENEYE